MTDTKTPEERSRNMSRIRSKDTKPEVIFRKLLFARGYRYRKNVNYIPGHPDLWLARYNTAIFIHGCFWHRHQGCKYAYIPKSRVEFWERKFENNINRDKKVRKDLAEKRIKCLIIWECSVKRLLRDEEFCNKSMNNIAEFLQGDELLKEI